MQSPSAVEKTDFSPNQSQSSILGWSIFILGAIFYSYEFLLRILPGVMTTELMQAHHLTTAGFGYLAAIYYSVYTLMQLPVGLLIDWYGPRRLLILASAICALGSFFFASSSLALACIGRFLVGFGSAFGFVGVLRLASLWLPEKRFALAAGLVTTIGMIGGVLGNVALSHLVVSAGWHKALVSSAWGGVLLTILFFFLPEAKHFAAQSKSKQQQGKYLLQQAGILLRMPVIWLNGIVGSLLYLPLSVFGELWGVSYLQTVQHLNRVEAALAVSWLMWGWAIGAPLVGWLADKTSSRYRMIFICSSLSCLLIIYILQTVFATHLGLFFAMLMFGILCSSQILMMVIVRDLCASSLLATGLAITNMIIMAGGMIFQPLIGIFMRAHSAALVAGVESASLSRDYSHAMYLIPAAIVVAIIVLGIQVRYYKRHQTKIQNSKIAGSL